MNLAKINKLNKIFRLFRGAGCEHEYKLHMEMPDGVTLSWGGRPTVSYMHVDKCQRCGATRSDSWIFHKDWILHPEYYPDWLFYYRVLFQLGIQKQLR